MIFGCLQCRGYSNALITPSEYYRSLLVGTPNENSFMSWITAVFCVSSILFGAHATTSMQKVSFSSYN